MRSIIKHTLGTICLSIFLALPAWAATILPAPVFPNAIQYDDFYSYSAKILTELGYPGYNIPTGTGGLDLLLMTGANGANNQNLAGDPSFDFADPLEYDNPVTQGTWSSSVDLLVNYLNTAFGPQINIPVFTFDLNQTGAEPNLWVTAYMTVTEGNTVIADWSFDNVLDGIYDSTAKVLAPGEITIEYPSGTFITVDNNKGSGKMDFVVYSPTMNLSEYTGKGYDFNVYVDFSGLNNGFEELFLTGAFAPREPNPVPEPGTVALLGLGLSALALMGRVRRK